MEWIQKIREAFATDRVYYTSHAKFEMKNLVEYWIEKCMKSLELVK